MVSERPASGVREVGVANNGSGGGVGAPGSENRQVQGTVVRWDRFLPFRSLKVLLVENDDCTRHVVSALLKNCSYEVVAVANGVQAWRYLEDLSNHTDLILTEVGLPVISGIGLLYKIMSHKSIKNIPVIMMSSHDSMGVVFKCLSRGAVDFLVKPIRKNELKNLWQHVWRRCQSSSGSGSESGTESRKSVRSRNRNFPDNANLSIRHDYERNDSSSDEDGECKSCGQSSWTKRAVEIGSPQPTDDETNDSPDSTCAQVIHTKVELACKGTENVNATKECEEQLENFGACKDRPLEQGVLQHFLQGNQTKGQNMLPEPDFAGNQNADFNHSNKENQDGRIRMTTTSLSIPLEDNAIEDVHAGFSEVHLSCCGGNAKKSSHSGGSLVQLVSGFVANGGGHTAPKLDAFENVEESSMPQNDGLAGQSNCSVQPMKIEKVDDVAIEIQVQPKESQLVHVEHHHHYHHYHHHIHDVQRHQTLTNQDQCVFEKPETVPLPCASSHAFTETGEGAAAGNFSMNGSGSGSHYGSNGKDVSQHGSNELDVITNTKNEDGVAENRANDIDNMNIVTNGPEEDRVLHREASPIKSRPKRKERSFEKKVSVQGRKK